MAGGRPTKYKKNLCKQALELFERGYSIVQIAAEFSISRDTIYEWENQYPEFSDTLAIGRTKAEAFWEGILQDTAKTKNAITNGNLALILKSR